MNKPLILAFFCAASVPPALAIDTDSENVFSVCFFSSQAAKSLSKYTSYQNYEIDGSYITLDEDFWAAARRVMVDLEAFAPIPLVTFGVDASKLGQDIALITSEPGVESDRIIPGLTATMLFGNDFIVRLNSKYSPNSYDAFMVVLMHEIGHFRMMRYLSHREYKKIPTILKELHADFLAGWFSAYIQDNHYKGKKNFRELGRKIFSEFGDVDEGSPQHHGSSEQRLTAFTFGWEVYASQRKMNALDIITGRPGYSNIPKLVAAERLVMRKLFSNHHLDADHLVSKHFFGPDSIPDGDSPASEVIAYGFVFPVDIDSIEKNVDLRPLYNAVKLNIPTSN